MTGNAGQILYINSEATDVTYTNLNHLTTDASAESDCVDLEPLHSGFYVFSWETSHLVNLFIDKLIVGDDEYSFLTPISFNTKDPHELCDAVQALNLGNSIIPTSWYNFKTKRGTFINRFVLKVDGSKNVYLRVKNIVSQGIITHLHIKGFDTLDPVPDRYHACSSYIQYLENIIIYTTTTSSTSTSTTSTTTFSLTTTSSTTEEPSTTTTTTEEIVETTTTTTTEEIIESTTTTSTEEPSTTSTTTEEVIETTTTTTTEEVIEETTTTTTTVEEIESTTTTTTEEIIP
jgi:hypothetical protein